MTRTAKTDVRRSDDRAAGGRGHRGRAGPGHLLAPRQDRPDHAGPRLRQHRGLPERTSPSSTARRESSATGASRSSSSPSIELRRDRFLLIYGRLPDRERAGRFQDRLTADAAAARVVQAPLRGLPGRRPADGDALGDGQHPGLLLPPGPELDEEEFDEEAAWLLSKARTIAAYSYRRSLGLPFIYPDPRLSLRGRLPAHDVLAAVRASTSPADEVVRALNLILILHADHELGCSTTTVRIVGSSRANLFASCAAGICSLWGPVHGGANVAVVEMLEAIHRGELTIDQAIGAGQGQVERLPAEGLRPPDLQELRPAGR